uniref:Uncharacterized protein n=1 Tax=Ciona savignyi TaxID=51511 RepID=H2YRL2_CIOSA
QASTCRKTGTSNCTTVCSKRRKRTITLRFKRANEENTGTALLALVRAPSSVCQKDCGLGACIVNRIRNLEECLCTENSFKNVDGKCTAKSNPGGNGGTTTQPQEDKTTLYVLIGLGCLVTLLIIIFLFVFFFRKRNVNQKDYELSHVNTHAIST